MAKKKAAKAAKAKKTSKRSTQTKPRARSPRSQALPGMEQVRSRRLDNICEAIGDERETINKAHREEKGLMQAALTEMHDRNLSVYKHGGVELALIPGAEKIRVRLVKEQGDAETGGDGGPSPEAPAGDEGNEPGNEPGVD